MPSARGLSRGLAQISQSFAQVGTIAEQQIRLDQRKDEHELNKLKKEIAGIEVEASKQKMGLNEISRMSQEADGLRDESAAKQWLKLPKQQARIQRIAEITGDDVETVSSNITNKSLANKAERDVRSKMFRGLANSRFIKKYDPDFAQSLNSLAGKIETAAPEEADRLNKIANESLKRYSALTRSFESGKAVISPVQASTKFEPAEPGDPGAQMINVAGQGEKLMKLKPRPLSATDQKAIERKVAAGFGLTGDFLSKKETKELFDIQAELEQDIAILTQEANTNVSAASSEIIKRARVAIKETEKELSAMIETLIKKKGSKDKEESAQAKDLLDRIEKQYGTVDVKRMTDSQKLRAWKQAPGNSLTGKLGANQPQQ